MNNKFKIVVAGCGGMSKTWIEYALKREDCEIVALVDIIHENAKNRAAEFNLNCKIYSEIEEAIKQTQANLVFDITIPSSHVNILKSAVLNGCDVMGEKPMAASMEEALEMLTSVETEKKAYSIMQNRRYLKNIRAFRQLVDDEVIGKPGFLKADFYIGAHFGGFRDIMDSPLILDMAIHTFDQARFILGSDPISVYCHEFNPEGSWYKGNSSAVCIFEFADGKVFNYNGSWSSEGYNTSWEADWRLMGSLGSAKWNGNDLPKYEVIVPGESKFINDFEGKETVVQWNGQEGHFGCLDEMFDALTNNRKAETDCTDNIKSMAMVFGALKSAQEQRKVSLLDLTQI